MLCETQLVQIGSNGAEHLREGGILYHLVHRNCSFFGWLSYLVEAPIFEIGVDARGERLLGLRQGLFTVAGCDGDNFIYKEQTEDFALWLFTHQKRIAFALFEVVEPLNMVQRDMPCLKLLEQVDLQTSQFGRIHVHDFTHDFSFQYKPLCVRVNETFATSKNYIQYTLNTRFVKYSSFPHFVVRCSVVESL